MQKLIKITDKQYIIVDNSEINDSDYVYIENKEILKVVTENNTLYTIGKYKLEVFSDRDFKVTHSTEPIESIMVANKYTGLGWNKISPIDIEEVKTLTKCLDLDVETILNKYSNAELYFHTVLNQSTEWHVEFINNKLKLI